jgi:hypothetical protein
MSDFTTATRIIFSSASGNEDGAVEDIQNVLLDGSAMEFATSLAGIGSALMLRLADALGVSIKEVAEDLMSLAYWADQEWADNNE